MKELKSPEGWSKKWIKIFLCMSCTMLCYLGVLLLTIGSVSKMQYEQLDVLMDIRMYRLVLFLMLVGTLCLLLAFIGFIGTWRENLPVLYTFCSLLAVFSLMEGTVAFIGYHQRYDMEMEMVTNLWSSVNHYPDDVSIQPYVDVYQTQLKCCGVYNYTDWLMAIPEEFTEDDRDMIAQFVPLSCCDPTDNTKCKIFDVGCHSRVSDIFNETGCTVVTNTLMAVLLQLGGAAFTFFLLRKLQLLTLKNHNLFQTEIRNPFGYSKMQSISVSTEKV
uniref:Tetraspanin n=1 Tax=Anopheles dirus TaxID=7168 RepID=A0A182NAX5_9DIPT